MNLIVPIPRAPVQIRPGTMNDLAFIDQLQSAHSKQVGWMPEKALRGKISAGHVLVAQDDADVSIGYVISQDQYFKRDDVGIVYQLCVAPARRRQFIGVALLKAVFDRAAYGCRLFCCWCAQDIQANYFWQSMGFVPLAYRSGSEKKGRVHIFWQKRIREGDRETPWWFPAKTNAGAMNADRIVLPIGPAMTWDGELPILSAVERPALEAQQITKPQAKPERGSKSQAASQSGAVVSRRRQFGGPSATTMSEPVVEKPKREKTPKVKVDPKMVFVREVRDRWLEHLNSGEMSTESQGKYDVTRMLAQSLPRLDIPSAALLPAA